MEYLILAGGGLQESLSDVLGGYAPFFWDVAAPIGLALLWVGLVYILLDTWFGRGAEGEQRGGFFFHLTFGLLVITLILCCGAALEFLVLGEGHVQAQVLAGVVNLVR